MGEEDWLHVGRLFVFVNTEKHFLSKILKKEVKVRYLDENNVEVVKSVKKDIIPRIRKGIKVDSKEIYSISLPKLNITVATSDRKVYRKGETAYVIVWAPQKPNTSVEIRVYRNDSLEYSDQVEVDEYGVAVYQIPDLELGEYRVEVDDSTVEFSVAEYRLPILQAVLSKYKLKNDKACYKVLLSKLGEPYEGEVLVGLYCDYCRAVVKEKKLKAKRGVLAGDFDLRGHTGPFSLYLTLPDGETASVDLPLSKYSTRTPLRVKALDKVYEISAAPLAEAEKSRALYFKQIGAQTSVIGINSIISDEVVLQAYSDIDLLVVVKYDLTTGKSKDCRYENLKQGDEIKLKIEYPYALLLVGVLTKENFYEYCVPVLPKEKTRLELSAPKVTKENKVKIVLTSNKKMKCILLVEDARTRHKTLEEELAEKTLKFLKEPYFYLSGVSVDLFSIIRPSMLITTYLPRSSIEEISRRIVSKGYPSRSDAVRVAIRELLSKDLSRVQPLALALDEGTHTLKELFLLKERELLYLEEFEVEGTVVKEIVLPGKEASYKIIVYGFHGLNLLCREQVLEVAKPVAVEIDAPNYISKGDLVEAKIHYKCREKGVLKIELGGKTYLHEVKGQGTVTVHLTEPTTLKAVLESNGEIAAASKKVIEAGLEKVVYSNILLLKEGTAIEAPKIVVYPSVHVLVKEIAEALLQYPFGCAEQTSAKLAGLAVVYKAAKQGLVDVDTNEVEKLIKIGVSRMKQFFKKGLFSLWEGGKPDVKVTVKVLRNLKPIYKLGFTEIDELIKRAKNTLLEKKIKDNELLYLDKKFYEKKIKCVEDAANVYFYIEEEREKALKYIKEKAVAENSYVYWKPTKAWAGALETTCEALKVLYHAGEKELFEKGFNYIAQHLVNNRLYSTPDTRALIELLSEIKLNETPVIEYNGKQIEVKKPTLFRNKIKVVKGECLAKIDKEKWINILTPTPNYKFQVLVNKTQLKLGEKTKIVVKLDEQTLAPLAKIWLPPGLVYPKGGANIQVVYKPIIGYTLEIEAVAVRKSRGKLRVLVHDMYNSSKVGTIPPIEIIVN